jgi:type II secretory pathway pseudopilin PulG
MKIENFKLKIKRSFTIIELLLYMGILSIILLVFIDLFISMSRMRNEAEAVSNVQQDSTYLLNKFIYDIHQAKSVSVPATPLAQSNTLAFIKGGINYTYSSQSGNLKLTDGTDNYQMNSYETTITNLVFTRLGSGNAYDLIKINLSIRSRVKKQSGYETTSVETTVGMREKP